MSLSSEENVNTVKISGKTINVEIADTEEKRKQGLSGKQKDDFKDDSGMLFVFETIGRPIFWMVDMNFPIDIVWIANEKIVDIDVNVPHPESNTPPNSLPRYSPSQSVEYVLEVNAGFTEKHGIKVGDKVEFSLSPNQ